MIKNLPAVQARQVRSLGQEDPLEEEMEALPVFLSGEFPRTEEPAGLQTVGSQDLDTT